MVFGKRASMAKMMELECDGEIIPLPYCRKRNLILLFIIILIHAIYFDSFREINLPQLSSFFRFEK